MDIKSLGTMELAQLSDEMLFKLSRSVKNQIAYAIRQKVDIESIKKLQVDHCYITREINMRREYIPRNHR